MGSLAAKAQLHPFDPLTVAEIQSAIAVVKKAHGDVLFNVVSLHEPRKAEMTKWLQDSATAPKPRRVADVVVIAPGGKVYDGLVDLEDGKITKWELLDGLQPIVSRAPRLPGSYMMQALIRSHRSPWRSSRLSSTSAAPIRR